MERFIVNEALGKFKDEGYAYEVIDGAHPSDGGPVALKGFYSIKEAQNYAQEQEGLACWPC